MPHIFNKNKSQSQIELKSDQLKLQGDKIKLESRPPSRESASSRSAYLLQGPSRPVSAVPMLALYKNKDEEDTNFLKSRRPYSAGNYNNLKDSLRSTSSLQSIDELDKDLPSNELLQNLLGESIVSWRNMNPVDPVGNSAKKDDSLLVLTPGLKTKPPLPKRGPEKQNSESSDDITCDWLNCKSAELKTEALFELINDRKNICDSDLLRDKLLVEEKQRLLLDMKVKEQEEALGIVNHGFEKNTIEENEKGLKGQKGPAITVTDCDGTPAINVGKTCVTFEEFFGDFVPEPKKVKDEELEKSMPLSKVPTKVLSSASKANMKPEVKEKPQNLLKKKFEKAKFVAKPIKSGKDFEVSGKDEESWMSNPDVAINVKKDADVKTKTLNAWDAHSDEGTCDEIEAILEVLEHESVKSHKQIESIKKIVTTELSAAINSIPNNGKCKEETRRKQVKEQSNECKELEMESVKSSGEESTAHSSNFNEILNFLDEVDKSSSRSLSNAKERAFLANNMIETTNIRLDTIPKLDDLLHHSQLDLSNQIIDLNLALKDKSSSIKILQEELSSLREQVMRTQKQTDKIVKEKVKSQKEESESVIKRHQRFIDQLMADKKSLSEQCEALVHEMKMLEDRNNSNRRAMEHKHSVEMKKVKEMLLANEKMRRERWIDTKTQKIKELTVKSIEPELEAMTVRHERELADLRAMHKREIEDIEMKNARKAQQQCEAIREQLCEEREKALAHERELMRIRYESMIETEEKSYQEQRKRLLQEQANRLAECEEREANVLAEKEKTLKQMKEECDLKIQLLMKRQEGEMNMQKDQLEMQLDSWKTAWKKQQETVLSQKESKIREQCRKERDREIEKVIERLEAEAADNKMQLDIATENRIRRIKEKFESELKEVELAQTETCEKYLNCKKKLQETEEILSSLQISHKHLEAQMKNLSESHEKLLQERSSLKEKLKEETKNEMVALEKELEVVKRDRDIELQQVYGRVKVAVARKDEMLAELSRDHMALKEKCQYLENMLEQQRKDYLIK